MDNEDEETEKGEDYEPQITSNNATERILARNLRIQRRVEALKKQEELRLAQEQAGGGEFSIESEIEKTPIDLQVEKSIALLQKLLIEGDEYVSNVKIATEAREADRRDREGIGKEKLIKELEEEAESAAAKFNEIADKWSGILKYNDPLHIHDDIINQKAKCDELIAQKDEIIATLREKLKKAEIEFSVDQRKQVEDVNSITRRIENQIIVMRKAYRQELKMIEEVILAERQLLIDANNKKWEELYKRRDQEEKANSEQRSEDYWKFVKELEDLNRDFLELYRSTTIKLENESDELQRELERIKADAVMNSEKLDYNYQILKKREDENLIIKSQQKRRINKLQDVINSLRKKNTDYHTKTVQQIDKLTKEIQRLTKGILDVEKKADHIAEVNDSKFNKIWNMNKARADKLFQTILEIDKVLHEQQLGLKWKEPEYSMPSSFIGGNVVPQSILKSEKSTTTMKRQFTENTEPDGIDVEKMVEYNKTLSHILSYIADKCGFLIEEQLFSILEPYLEHERTLIKVDNVFAALNLENRKDIDLLMGYFRPYMFCPICNVPSDAQVTSDTDESILHVYEMATNLTELDVAAETKTAEQTTNDMLREKSGMDKQDGTLIEFGPLAVTLFDDNLRGECRGPDALLVNNKDSVATADIRSDGLRIPCEYVHPLMISSVYVLRALKEFIAKYHTTVKYIPTMASRLAFERNTASRLLAASDIKTYWETYTTLFPKEREQLWDSLLEGLKRYHELLKARKIASEEVVGLRQQNSELRRIFANYLDKSDVPY